MRCLRKTSPRCHSMRCGNLILPLSDTKIRTFHTEIITICHSSNVPFYQLLNICARGIPLSLKFCRVARIVLVYRGVKFGMMWTPSHAATRSEISFLMYSRTQILNFATRYEASRLSLERHLSVLVIKIY